MPVEVHLRELQTVVDEVGTQLHRALQVRGRGVPTRAAQEARSEQRLRQEPGHPGQPSDLRVPGAQHMVRPVVARVEGQGPRGLVVDDPAVAHPLPTAPSARVAPQRVRQREMPLCARRVHPDRRLGQGAGRLVQAIAAATFVAGKLLGDVDRGFGGLPPRIVRGRVQCQGALKLGQCGLRLQRGAQAVAAGKMLRSRLGAGGRRVEREHDGGDANAAHASEVRCLNGQPFGRARPPLEQPCG